MTRRPMSMVVAVALSGLVAACSSNDEASPGGSSGATSGSSSSSGSSGTSGGSADSGSDGSSGSSGDSGASSSGATGGVPASCNGDEGGAVPSTPVELQAWLGTGKYKCWAHEAKVHKSTGPHGGNVQTYLNAKLDASMKGTAEHPKDSVAVKEFYGSGTTTVTGWAVLVKTQDTSASGQGYYWYEAFGTQAGASTIEGQGKTLCVNCHADGKDYVLIPYPLL